MKILGLDTAMAACSATIIDTDHATPMARAFVAMDRGHAEALAPMIEQVIRKAELSISDIDRVVVTTGPGTFTGVRIGLAMARGLGLARDIPVIGVDTLTAIAANDDSKAALLVVCDARNDEVYAALYDAARNVVQPPAVMTRQEAAELAPEGSVVIGTAALSVMEVADGHYSRSLSSPLPDAAVFAKIGARREPGPMPAPLYLRAPDAKPQQALLRSQIALRDTGPEAAAVLAELHRLSFDDPWTDQSFASLLMTPGASATIAEERSEPLGFLLTRCAADEAEIITVATRPDARRRGVARMLIEHQLSKFPAYGVAQVFLEVGEENAAARALYQSLGFAEAGRRRDYYRRTDGSVGDAVLMKRMLRP